MTKKFVLVFALLGLGLRSATAVELDAIIFGDVTSEQNHGLVQTNSEIFRGGLGEPARRLLPKKVASYAGGTLYFQLKVDPGQQNYFTVKLWGGDQGEEHGRLILYLDGRQAGYRHEGDYDVLNQCDAEAIFPGRFLYQTLPLPPMLTRGKTNVLLAIEGLGRMWPYARTLPRCKKI